MTRRVKVRTVDPAVRERHRRRDLAGEAFKHWTATEAYAIAVATRRRAVRDGTFVPAEHAPPSGVIAPPVHATWLCSFCREWTRPSRARLPGCCHVCDAPRPEGAPPM